MCLGSYLIKAEVDLSSVIGGDTIHLGRGDKHFGNADLSFTGDRIHNGAFHSINLTNFGGIGFKSNTTDGILNADMIMDTTNGYSLVLKSTPEPGKDSAYFSVYEYGIC